MFDDCQLESYSQLSRCADDLSVILSPAAQARLLEFLKPATNSLRVLGVRIKDLALVINNVALTPPSDDLLEDCVVDTDFEVLA